MFRGAFGVNDQISISRLACAWYALPPTTVTGRLFESACSRRLLDLEDSRAATRRRVLYVLSGTASPGSARRAQLRPGCAVRPGGLGFGLRAAARAVRSPCDPDVRRPDRRLRGGRKGPVPGRQFDARRTPASATRFISLIPRARGPPRYDGDLRAGGGGTSIDGERALIPPRHVFHLPRRSCIATTRASERCVLGVSASRLPARRLRTARLPSSPRARRAERCRTLSARSTSSGKETSPVATGRSPDAAARSPSCRSPWRRASRSSRAKRARRSCWRRRTRVASRCRSRAS